MKNKPTVLFVSSYPPRECGIATFTQDTIAAILKTFHPNFILKVAALNESSNIDRNYPDEVLLTVNKNKESYIDLASFVNDSIEIQAVVLEHEFGLYSGDFGEDLLHFTSNLKKPYLLISHTVLSEPEAKMKEVMNGLITHSYRSIVMTKHAKKLLVKKYGADKRKLLVIPHGFHLRPTLSPEALKEKYNCSNRVVLSTFGLLSRNKGIEFAIDALSQVNNRNFIIYFILGKTHPEVIKHDGEEYREFLEAKTKEYGLEDNVKFINRFLDLDELLEYLEMTDIYLFTSVNPEQAISGTLTYALGAGCAVLTTPISHANEIIEENAALSFNFGESYGLAQLIDKLVADESLRKALGARAKVISRKGVWENIAIRYADLFAELFHFNTRLSYVKPDINLHHLKAMTNNLGMFQFTDQDVPDENFGFTLDDNARALYVISKYCEIYPGDNHIEKLQKVYLKFIKRCQLPDGGFLNYVDKNGDFTDQNFYVNTDEAGARAMLALCHLVHSPVGSIKLKKKAKKLIDKSLSHMSKVMSPRAIGKLLKGLYYLYNTKKDHRILEIIYQQSDYLCHLFEVHSTNDWEWFEPHLSYSNSDISEGLLYASKITQNDHHRAVGLQSLEFLIEKMFDDKMAIPVSHRSIISSEEENSLDPFGQQPVEVASLIECLDIAYRLTNSQGYYDLLIRAFTWFLGNNLLRQIVYNPATGAGHDGIEKNGININQGAEASLSYLISLITIEKSYEQKDVLKQYEMIE